MTQLNGHAELDIRQANKPDDAGWIKNLWHFLYVGAFSFGLYKIIGFLDNSIKYSSLLLYIFSFVIWFRFWWYDNVNPGYKRKYPCSEHPRAWTAYLSGFAVIALLSLIFFVIDNPLFYMAILTFLYFTKAIWHLFHRRLIGDYSTCKKILRLAVISDAVVASIFGCYSFLFIANFLLAPIVSLPPIVEIDLSSEAFRFITGLFIIGVVAALEAYYFVCHKIVEELVST